MGTREPDSRQNEVANAVIGAAIDVHRELGPGFLESVYEEALAVELGLRRMSFARQPIVPVYYKGVQVGEGRLDLLVDGRLVVEIKAVETVLPVHRAQVISYLRSTGLPLGLILNFKTLLLKDGIERIVYTR